MYKVEFTTLAQHSTSGPLDIALQESLDSLEAMPSEITSGEEVHQVDITPEISLTEDTQAPEISSAKMAHQVNLTHEILISEKPCQFNRSTRTQATITMAPHIPRFAGEQ